MVALFGGAFGEPRIHFGPGKARRAAALAVAAGRACSPCCAAASRSPRCRAPATPPSPEELQWQALAIAPLSAGGRTGLRMVATQAVEPIDFAPDRPTVELAMTLGAGDSMRALLDPRRRHLRRRRRRAAAMIAAAAPAIASGTAVSVVLGAEERRQPPDRARRAARRARR